MIHNKYVFNYIKLGAKVTINIYNSTFKNLKIKKIAKKHKYTA